MSIKIGDLVRFEGLRYGDKDMFKEYKNVLNKVGKVVGKLVSNTPHKLFYIKFTRISDTLQLCECELKKTGLMKEIKLVLSNKEKR